MPFYASLIKLRHKLRHKNGPPFIRLDGGLGYVSVGALQ
jgi:hypothetical protein